MMKKTLSSSMSKEHHMTSVSQIQEHLDTLFQDRADELAKTTGCVQRQVCFRGSTLLQTLVFGWSQHAKASLSQLASQANIQHVKVSGPAIHQRFTPNTATFLQAILLECVQIVVRNDFPLNGPCVRPFAQVVLEDSSTISLPEELAVIWQGCGGGGYGQQAGSAAVKLHTCLELKSGQLWGPELTNGRVSDRRSPFRDELLPPSSLKIEDLGYFDSTRIRWRQEHEISTLSRCPANVQLLTRRGTPIQLREVLPKAVGKCEERDVLVSQSQQVPMRLLMIRVPVQVAAQRRRKILQEATRRNITVSQESLFLADWTILLTDVPCELLSITNALVLLRERWQMEQLYKLWKSEGEIDEWVTSNPWRILCEMYAKLIAVVIQHWMSVIWAWDNEQKSLQKLAQAFQDTAGGIMEAFAGLRTLESACLAIGRRMQSGCEMNKRRQHPNAAQLLEEGVSWAIGP
jgi:hypothetical protein